MPNAPIDKDTDVPVHMVFRVAISIRKVIVNYYFEHEVHAEVYANVALRIIP